MMPQAARGRAPEGCGSSATLSSLGRAGKPTYPWCGGTSGPSASQAASSAIRTPTVPSPTLIWSWVGGCSSRKHWFSTLTSALELGGGLFQLEALVQYFDVRGRTALSKGATSTPLSGSAREARPLTPPPLTSCDFSGCTSVTTTMYPVSTTFQLPPTQSPTPCRDVSTCLDQN